MTLKKAPVQKEGADQSLTPQDVTDILTALGLLQVVKGLVAGTGITIDDSDPENPIINASGVSIAWGDITGTLSDQTDLQSILDDKVDTVSGKELAYPDTHLEDLSFSGAFEVDIRTFSSYRLNLTGNSSISLFLGSLLPINTSKVINLIVTSDTQTETFGILASFNQYGTYDPAVRNMVTISITKDASGNLEHDVFINQPD